MKKIVNLILIGILFLGITGCQHVNDTNTEKKDNIVTYSSLFPMNYYDEEGNYYQENHIDDYIIKYTDNKVNEITTVKYYQFISGKTKEEIKNSYETTMADFLQNLKDCYSDYEDGSGWERNGYTYYGELTDDGYKIIEEYTLKDMNLDEFTSIDGDTNEKSVIIGPSIDLLTLLNKDGTLSLDTICKQLENDNISEYIKQ